MTFYDLKCHSLTSYDENDISFTSQKENRGQKLFPEQAEFNQDFSFFRILSTVCDDCETIIANKSNRILNIYLNLILFII